MNPQDPLAELNPLRQPELIGWWPLAPGWWIVLCLVLVATAVLIYLLRKRHARNAYRRRALLQLQALHAQFQADGNTREYLGHINALLKSVAMLSYPRTDTAAQHGEAWRIFLNLSLPPAAQLPSDFDNAVYQQHSPDIDMTQVYQAAQLWIKTHKGAP